MNDVGKMFRIRISNSIDHSVLRNDGTFVSASTVLEHGYGIKTIESITDKYNGYISFSEENYELIATVMLPVFD